MWKNLPNKLYPGLELPIYTPDNDGNYRFEFNAVLVEPAKTWRGLEPVTWEEKKPESESINAVKESWKVMVKSDSPFENGKKFVRWIPRFHSKGPIRIIESTPPELDENYEEENDNW